MNRTTTNFFFPVETTARELDQKIIMGILVSEKGRKIYIGEQQLLRNLSFIVKRGIFYGKHLFGKSKFSDQKYYRRLKRNNFSVIHLNEEGAIWPGDETDWKNIMKFVEKPSVLDKDDYLLEWGKFQKDFYNSLEPHNTNIISTGHPRFDLYKDGYSKYYAKEVLELKEKYGDFILVNTSASWSNHGTGTNKFTFKRTMFYNPDKKSDREFRFGKWVNQTKDIANLVELINEISLEFPNENIIIRPHPSEDSQMYKDIFQNIKNIQVVYEGSPSSWILACVALIHTSSTTAIEAALANKLIINYKPNGMNKYDVKIPCLLGYECKNTNEAIKLLKKYSNTKINYDFNKLPDYALDMFHNFQFKSIDIILDIFNKAEQRLHKKQKKLNYFELKIMCILNEFYHILKKVYLLTKQRQSDYSDFKKRFEKFNVKKIRTKIEAAEQVTGKNVKFTYINKYLFTLETREK